MSVYGLCLRAISAGCISAFCSDLRLDGRTGTTGDMPDEGGPFMSRPAEPKLAIASAALAESIPIPPALMSPPLIFDSAPPPPPPPKPEPDCWLSPPAKSCGKELPDADPDPDPFEPIPPNNCMPSERSPSWSD